MHLCPLVAPSLKKSSVWLTIWHAAQSTSEFKPISHLVFLNLPCFWGLILVYFDKQPGGYRADEMNVSPPVRSDLQYKFHLSSEISIENSERMKKTPLKSVIFNRKMAYVFEIRRSHWYVFTFCN